MKPKSECSAQSSFALENTPHVLLKEKFFARAEVTECVFVWSWAQQARERTAKLKCFCRIFSSHTARIDQKQRKICCFFLREGSWASDPAPVGVSYTWPHAVGLTPLCGCYVVFSVLNTECIYWIAEEGRDTEGVMSDKQSYTRMWMKLVKSWYSQISGSLSERLKSALYDDLIRNALISSISDDFFWLSDYEKPGLCF